MHSGAAFPDGVHSEDLFSDNVYSEETCQDYIHDVDALRGNIYDMGNHNDIFDTNSLMKEKMESRNMDANSSTGCRMHKYLNLLDSNNHKFPNNLIHYSHSNGYNTMVDCTQQALLTKATI